MNKNSPSFIRNLKKYTSSDNYDLDKIFDGLEKESDRAAIVIEASMVEDALKSLIEAFMRVPETKREENDIWGPQGVLSSFSAKIKLAFALEWVDENSATKLDVLREMRNACAHSQMPISFEVPELQSACEKFLFGAPSSQLLKTESNSERYRRAFDAECLRLGTLFLKKSVATYRSQYPLTPPSPQNALASIYTPLQENRKADPDTDEKD